MINQTKNILGPKLRFPEFKDAGEWQKETVGEIAQVTSGGTPDSTNEKFWNGDIPWMNSGELNNKRINSVSNKITSLGLEESSTKLIPPQCVLIGLAGQGKTRGTAAINYIELCTNQSIASIHPNNGVFNSEFLYQRMDSMYDQLRALSTGEGGRGGLNLQIIKSIEVPLPILDEQQKIADCLSSLDEYLTAQSDKLEAFKVHKKGLMQQLFPTEGDASTGSAVPKLRFAEFRDSGEWSFVKLGEVCEFTQGVQIPSSEQTNIFSNGYIRYLYIRDFFTDKFKCYVQDKYPDKVIEKDEIMMVNTGNTAGQAYRGVRGVLSNNSFKITFNRNKINGSFLFTVLTGDFIQNQIQTFFNAAGQPHLGHKNVSLLPFTYPALPEQQKIADCLSSLDKLIKAQSEKIETLKAHKKGLMQQLFPLSGL
jgi:type I restriction enzyme S subunit